MQIELRQEDDPLQSQDEPPLPDIKTGMYPVEYSGFVLLRRRNIISFSGFNLFPITIPRNGNLVLGQLRA